jgi:hypothetical protein
MEQGTSDIVIFFKRRFLLSDELEFGSFKTQKGSHDYKKLLFDKILIRAIITCDLTLDDLSNDGFLATDADRFNVSLVGRGDSDLPSV